MTQFTLHTLDLPSLHRHAIGFDQLFEQLECCLLVQHRFRLRQIQQLPTQSHSVYRLF